MMCEHCIHFQGLENECLKEVYVCNGLEAVHCNDYLYNGDTNDGKTGQELS